MADLEIGLLRSFSVAAAEGSFSAAARRLNCSQGTISMRLKTLEDRCGAPLFQRNYHRLALTAAGGRLLPLARRLLRLHDEAKLALKPETPRWVRIGVAEDYAGAWLAAVLDLQSETDPDVELEIVTGMSPQLITMVEEGRLDFAVATPHEDSAFGVLMSRRQLRWVCAPDFTMPLDNRVPLALYQQGCLFRQNALDVLEQAGRDWRIVISSASGRGVLAVVEAGRALTLTPEGMIPPQLREADPEWGLPELGETEIRLVKRRDAPDWLDAIEAVLMSTYQS